METKQIVQRNENTLESGVASIIRDALQSSPADVSSFKERASQELRAFLDLPRGYALLWKAV